MKKIVMLGPLVTWVIGVVISLLVGMLLFSISTAIVHPLVVSRDFYSEITEIQQKIIVYFPGVFLIIISVVSIFINGIDIKGEKIPEIEEQKELIKKIEESKRAMTIEEIKKTPPVVVTPIATTAGSVPVGFIGFYLLVGKPIKWFTLSIGKHWKFPLPGIMDIAIVQNQMLTSEFKVIDPSKLITEVSNRKFDPESNEPFRIGRLAGSLDFFASGFYTTSVCNIFKYFNLSDSTRKEGLDGKIRKAARDFVRNKSIEELMLSSSKDEMLQNIKNVIGEMTPEPDQDDDLMTVDMFAIRVEDVTVDQLEVNDDATRKEFAKPALGQINEFNDKIRYRNHAEGVAMMVQAGVKNAEKASENILAMDKDAKMDIRRNEDQIEFTGDAKGDGSIFYLIKKFLENQGKK